MSRQGPAVLVEWACPGGHRAAAHGPHGGGSDMLFRARSARIHCVPREMTARLLLGEGTSYSHTILI